MTLTVMRKKYKKFQSRIISYRSYRHFSNKSFRENLLHNLSKVNLVNDVDGFQKLCDKILRYYDNLNGKYVSDKKLPLRQGYEEGKNLFNKK